MLSTYRDKRGEEGFTLIELLVVIIIIGILAAIAIPTFLGQRDRARRGAMQSDLRNVAIAYETYYTDYGTYDDAGAGIAAGYNASTDVILVQEDAGTRAFCVSATHSAWLPAEGGEEWYFDSDSAAEQLSTTGC